jgi:3-oxoadipate enol-lactonase
VPDPVPVPPVPLLPGRYVDVPGLGELFVRDSGGAGPVVLLLHGWMFASDLNWAQQYGPLVRAGYRVLAMDHRGHGRGLRSRDRFTLAACADDAAALLAALDAPPAVAVGYSMGGPVAQLLAQRHPDRVAGVVLCATAMDWQDPRQKAFWRTMGLLRVLIAAHPRTFWRTVMRAGGRSAPEAAWVAAELSRGRARELAEAGRELGRFDSAPWIGGLSCPAAVVVTARDRLVPPRKQRALAAALRVRPVEVQADHDACAAAAGAFNRGLLSAVAHVVRRQQQVAG